MTMVDPQAALISGPPRFATISNVRAVPTNNGFTVYATTDVAIQLQLDYWSQNDPSIPPGVAGTAPAEAGPLTQHVFVVTLPGGNNRSGFVYGYNFRQDSNDTSGFQWRGFQGTIQTTGARSTRGQTLPVRWNMFGDGTRPAGGGGIGNWSSYTWAQYNPKGTTYPTP